MFNFLFGRKFSLVDVLIVILSIHFGDKLSPSDAITSFCISMVFMAIALFVASYIEGFIEAHINQEK